MRLLGGIQKYTWSCNSFSILKVKAGYGRYGTGAGVAHRSGLLIEGGLKELFLNTWF